MKSFVVVLLLLFASLSYAANLTSCISPSLVTCPAGAVVHNVGSCPNGFVLWGCQYPNGTVVSTALPNATTTIATIPPTPAISNVSPPAISAPVSTAPVSTIPPISAPSSNSAMLLYISIAIVIVIILILYYVLVSRKGLKASS